jgi:hypothetical protein
VGGMLLRLDDNTLLDASEQASGVARPWRELIVLAAACDTTVADLARLPVGERDRLLLELRARTFGDRLDCETSCPSCGAHLELALSAAELCESAAHPAAADFEVLVDGERLTQRLPDSSDIAASAQAPDRASAILFERCIERRQPDGAHPLGEGARDSIAARLADLDPMADVQLQLRCPVCDHAWDASFDPAGFLLREIDTYAAGLLDDVHLLGRAYGWREADILAMSPLRRRQYRERVLE